MKSTTIFTFCSLAFDVALVNGIVLPPHFASNVQNPLACGSPSVVTVTTTVTVPEKALPEPPLTVANGTKHYGETCGAGSECMAGFCNSMGYCGLVHQGEACHVSPDCQNGFCNSKGNCGAWQDGLPCNVAADCASHFCNSIGSCGLQQQYQDCGVNADCVTKFCAAGTCALTNVPDGATDKCVYSSQCASGFCNSWGLCGKQADGTGCNNSNDCKTNLCNYKGQCGLVGSHGDCRMNSDCASGICNVSSSGPSWCQ